VVFFLRRKSFARKKKEKGTRIICIKGERRTKGGRGGSNYTITFKKGGASPDGKG